MGAKASTIPVLAAENSPASIRGSLVMGWQVSRLKALFTHHARKTLSVFKVLAEYENADTGFSIALGRIWYFPVCLHLDSTKNSFHYADTR